MFNYTTLLKLIYDYGLSEFLTKMSWENSHIELIRTGDLLIKESEMNKIIEILAIDKNEIYECFFNRTQNITKGD